MLEWVNRLRRLTKTGVSKGISTVVVTIPDTATGDVLVASCFSLGGNCHWVTPPGWVKDSENIDGGYATFHRITEPGEAPAFTLIRSATQSDAEVITAVVEPEP